jgi:hypothetical protein
MPNACMAPLIADLDTNNKGTVYTLALETLDLSRRSPSRRFVSNYTPLPCTPEWGSGSLSP